MLMNVQFLTHALFESHSRAHKKIISSRIVEAFETFGYLSVKRKAASSISVENGDGLIHQILFNSCSTSF